MNFLHPSQLPRNDYANATHTFDHADAAARAG